MQVTQCNSFSNYMDILGKTIEINVLKNSVKTHKFTNLCDFTEFLCRKVSTPSCRKNYVLLMNNILSITSLSASRLLRRKIPQSGHLMTSKRFWMQSIPDQVIRFCLIFPFSCLLPCNSVKIQYKQNLGSFYIEHAYTLSILFSSNHNIHKSSSGLCFGLQTL